MNKKKKSTNTSPYPDEVIDRLARAFYPAILACWNSEEGQREFAAWQAEQAHLAGKEKQEVPACWVSVKQFSKNDTATACQDWLRSTRLGRGSIKPHVRTVKVLGMGLFAFQEHVHLWQGVTYWTLYQSRVPRVLRPFGIPAHIACGRCGFAAQKASQKAYPAVCGEEKALLRNVITYYNTFSPAVCKV